MKIKNFNELSFFVFTQFIFLLLLNVNPVVSDNFIYNARMIQQQSYPLIATIRLCQESTEFPVVSGAAASNEDYIFAADNATGMIYKYQPETLKLIDKFSAFPDALKPISANKRDAAVFKFYYKEETPFNIALEFSQDNTLFVYNKKKPEKIRQPGVFIKSKI